MQKEDYFQDHMPGNICFGCGASHPEGLRIKSYWQGETSVCWWQPHQRFCGWKGVLNGGILATIMDCHSMCTAMAYAYRRENRTLGSTPIYRYATASISIQYLKPTYVEHKLLLRSRIVEQKGKKTLLNVEASSLDVLTATGTVTAVRVYNSSQSSENDTFAR